MEVKFAGAPCTITLEPDEVESLARILDKYHIVDTAMALPGGVADDDVDHYLAEELRNRLLRKSEEESLNPKCPICGGKL